MGRGREVGEVKRLLAKSRLLTLTGIGGVGKTRLSLRVAAQVRRAFRDGVWFVDLSVVRDTNLLTSEVPDSQLLAHLVAVALGIREQTGSSALETLTSYLRDRNLLLLLDNCEHLVDRAAMLVEALLSSCAAVRVLTTSREPLGIVGETLYIVPPLTVPDAREPLSQRAHCESVALLVARGEAILGFQVGEESQEAVDEICRRLDGLPLAIELAAARLRVLTAQQILERLSDHFGLLSRGNRSAPERQQTLRACVDWSFELCSKSERILWSRLSVFAGGFGVDAVEGICTDRLLTEAELLDVVAGLVDKSILITDDHEPVVRFRMLEVLRAYGAEKLGQAGEEMEVRRRHRDWYRQLVEVAHTEWISDRQAYWLGRLSREHANLRAAVEFCLGEPAEAAAALQIAVSVPTLYWWAHGLMSEGRSWLGRALAQGHAPGTLEARALLLAAHLAIAQGDVEAGMPLLERGTQLARRRGAPAELAYSTHNRGVARLFGGDVSGAVDLYERSLIILSTAPEVDPELRLNLLHSRGVAAALIGDHQRTAGCYAETLAITEPVGEDFYRSKAMWFCGLSFWRQRDLDQATTQALESLRVKQTGKLDDLYGVAQCVELLAWTAAGEQQYRRAATLLGAADKLRADMGIPISSLGHLIAYHDDCEKQARVALGEPTYLQALREGRSLSCDEALAYALERSTSKVPAQSRRSATPLTRREQQIAELLAQGLSNRDIANALVISQRTAESHVEHILMKLGFSSRSQVAAWMAKQQASGT